MRGPGRTFLLLLAVVPFAACRGGVKAHLVAGAVPAVDKPPVAAAAPVIAGRIEYYKISDG